MKISIEKVKEVANRYGLKVIEGIPANESGLYVGERKIEMKELFPEMYPEDGFGE